MSLDAQSDVSSPWKNFDLRVITVIATHMLPSKIQEKNIFEHLSQDETILLECLPLPCAAHINWKSSSI